MSAGEDLALAGLSLAGAIWQPNRVRPPAVGVGNIFKSWEDFLKFLGQDQTPTEKSFNVLDVDLEKRQNKHDHRTHLYEHKELIVRRGWTFTLSVKVDKKFEKDDVIKLQFLAGDQPRESLGTMFLITLGDTNNTKTASAVIVSTSDNTSGGSTIRLKVNLPCDSTVGNFRLCIRLMNKDAQGNSTKYTSHKLKESIIVLYNPWCEDDTVYLSDEAERKEYVMSESGQVFVSEIPYGRSWVFGQFDKVSLDAALYILEEKSNLPRGACGNPVRVTRCLSAMLNSDDHDGGVLTGNWTGDYEGGESPTVWNGSLRILEQYMQTKKDVKFGQCWVFSGLSVTICRALGIPARSITTVQSGIDKDKSMTIDYHVTESGKSIRHLNDATWNFHVWCEAWFKRPDLPDGNDGWQAFDATPQQPSDGIMRCGPAPLNAIKEGNVHLGYDTKFFFAEVNADSVTWEVNALEERRAISLETDSVGHKISTKAVGKRQRHDITNEYKYPEGSEKERDVAKIVSQRSSRREDLKKLYDLDKEYDVKMAFEGKLTAKADVDFQFKAVNESQEDRTVSARITLVARYYSGADGDTIMEEQLFWTLSGGAEKIASIPLAAADWLNRVAEDATIGVYVIGKVKETGQSYIHRESYNIDKQQLDMQVTKEPTKVGVPFDVKVTFTNFLDIPVTQGSFTVEGAGISTRERVFVIGDEIGPGESVSRTITLKPRIPGDREVIASFQSRQLTGIFGAVDVKIDE